MNKAKTTDCDKKFDEKSDEEPTTLPKTTELLDIMDKAELSEESDEEYDHDAFTQLFDESECRTEITEHLPKNMLKFTDSLVVRRVYLLGRILSKVFHHAGLPYWATGGTSLGIERHKGLIPWDDDLDFCLLDEHEEQLESLAPTLLEHGVELVTAYSGYRLWHTSDSHLIEGPTRKSDCRYPFCDMFIMRQSPTESPTDASRFELRNGGSRTLWTDEWYPVADVEPRQLRTFGNYHLMCANRPTGYLERTYGANCMRVGATHNRDHVAMDGGGFQSQPVCLETVGLEPAKPFE